MNKEQKWEDFYSPDGKTEYCYDIFGNKHEVGPSFKDIPMGVKCISCPICRTCKNQYFVEERFDLLCKARGKIPEELDMGKVFKCEFYEPDESSPYYALVKTLMEEHKDD